MTEDRRVAIVAGLRTPFQKQGTGFASLSALDLGVAVTAELMARNGLAAADLDQLVFGQVLPSLHAPNVAREIVLAAGLSPRTDAYSVSRACTTSYQALVNAADAIALGRAQVAIAGGTDSASDVPITVHKHLAQALLKANRAKTLTERLGALSGLRPSDLLPVPPAIVEYSTGLSMGESAEKMAKENGITRASQDALAHQSHVKAAAAWADGRTPLDVMTVYAGPKLEPVFEDNLVRKDSQEGAYGQLKPAFDKRHGTVTAGNASPLTDGAAALLLMSADRAQALGYAPLGYLRAAAFSAIDPRGQLLMGPAYAIPKALDQAKLSWSDLGLIDMHEAFAAQVLSNTQAIESAEFASRELGRSERIGTVDWGKFNVRGGSIAVGHPFAATGARQVLQTLREQKRRGVEFSLVTACAAGGLGAALILEATA